MRICTEMKLSTKTNIVFLLLLLLFVLLQSQMYSPLLSDENQYFLLGKEVSEGNVPYRGFFYSHPPLQLYVFAFIFKLVGYNFFLLKSVAIISTLTSAMLIYRLIEGNTTKLIAVSLFLFNATVFFSGATNMGINLTCMITLLGFYHIKRGRLFVGGMLFGLAFTAGVYSIVIFLATLLFLWKKSLKAILGFIAVVLPSTILFYFISGFDYIRQVFLYHLGKPMEGSALKLAFFSNLVIRDFVLFGLVILSITFFIANKEKFRNIYLYNILAYIIFLAFISKPISYYVIIVYPFVVLFIAGMAGRIKAGNIRFAALICIFLLIGFMGYRSAEGIVSFNEMNRFGKLGEITEYMQGKEGKLFGDFDIATIIALEADMDMIVSSELDTYPLAVKLLGIQKISNEIERLKPDYIIIHRIGSTTNPLWKAERIKNIMDSYCYSMSKMEEYRNEYVIYNCNMI